MTQTKERYIKGYGLFHQDQEWMVSFSQNPDDLEDKKLCFASPMAIAPVKLLSETWLTQNKVQGQLDINIPFRDDYVLLTSFLTDLQGKKSWNPPLFKRGRKTIKLRTTW